MGPKLKVGLGIVLLAGGILSLCSLGSDFGIFWTGGIIAGIILIVSGSREMERANLRNLQVSRIRENQEELISRIEDGQSIDEIASDFYEVYHIPPVRTIFAAANLVKLLVESGDEDALMFAAFISSKQVIDSDMSPEDTIDRFSFVDQVYFVEEEVRYYYPPNDPDEELETVEGTLILCKGYLFFFAKIGGVGADQLMEAIDSARGLHPLLAVISDGYALVSGLSKELEDYFTRERTTKLKQRFADENSFAIPVADIVRLGQFEKEGWLLSRAILRIKVKNETAEEEKVYLLANKSGNRDWVSQWRERIKLACIAEGKLLIQSPQNGTGSS